jgi:aryl-alcohol dehydrogenase-like predicted oxidoreductase
MTRIGTSDLDVVELNLGGNVFSWTADKSTSFAILDTFVEAGGNFIDTADSYAHWVPGNTGGDSELIIGEWMHERGNHSDVVVATKVSQHPEFRGLSADTVAAAADASLTRLGVDSIDLYYAHFDDENTPLEETVGAFDALVKAGKVRYVGISNYTADRVEQWFDIAERDGFVKPVALQPHYNLVRREPFERELAPVAERFGLGVFPYFSLGSGFLTGKYRTTADFDGKAREGGAAQYLTDAGLRVVDELADIAEDRGVAIATVALAWLRFRPTVVAPIASASRPEQVADLIAAVHLDLSAEEVARLDDVSAPV